MTVSFTHLRVSSVPDSTDATLIQPSDWNAGHVLTCASGVLLGRTSAGDGAVEEVSLGGLPITGGSINGTPIGGTTPAAGTFTTLTGNSTCAFGAGNANYSTADGAAAGYSPVFQALGSDANISMVFKPKGTGAIDLAAGSKGVVISNGGTVTAITRTSGGSYTSVPDITVAPPTTPGGVQATVQSAVYALSAPITSAGVGYSIGNVLTAVGGATGAPFTATVSSIDGLGGVTGINISAYGYYTATPINPVTFTGGSGSGFTSTMAWQVHPILAVLNPGSGYIEQPSVTFSGGGGSGAAAYATVGSSTQVRSLGSTLSFYTPGGEQFRVADTQNSTAYIQAQGAASGFQPFLVVGGSATNIALGITTKGNGGFNFYTATGTVQQFSIAHTASAVNYLSATGGATGNPVTLSAQGSNADIDLSLTPKGAGLVRFGTYTAAAVTATGYISIKDSTGTTYKVLVST